MLAFLSALLACAILTIVLATLVYKGFSQLSLDFFHESRAHSSARRVASRTRSSAARSSSGWRW